MNDAAIHHLREFLRHASQSDPEAMTPATAAAILDVERLLVDWLKAVREIWTNKVKAGQATLPGFRLAPGRSVREWRTEAEAIEAMGAAGINDPYERKLRSVAEAEKLVNEQGKRVLEAAWDKRPGNPTLKKESAAIPTPPVFGPIEAPASAPVYVAPQW